MSSDTQWTTHMLNWVKSEEEGYYIYEIEHLLFGCRQGVKSALLTDFFSMGETMSSGSIQLQM